MEITRGNKLKVCPDPPCKEALIHKKPLILKT